MNARLNARLKAEQARADKPKPFVTAAEVRALPAVHPARWAWTVAAHQGPAAATKAFHEAMAGAAALPGG